MPRFSSACAGTMRLFKPKQIKSPGMTREQALGCTPVKSVHVSEQRLGEGEVVISYPMAVKPGISRLLERFGGRPEKVRVKKLQLDELGTAVWDMLDGRSTVREIVGEFAAAHRLEPKEAEVSVTHFLRMLGQRGLIGLR